MTLSQSLNQLTLGGSTGTNGLTIYSLPTATQRTVEIPDPLGAANFAMYNSNTVPAAGTVLIGNGTGAMTPALLSGTAGEVTVTSTSGSIVLSTPQSIATTANPTFANITATNAVTASVTGAGSVYPLIANNTTAGTSSASFTQYQIASAPKAVVGWQTGQGITIYDDVNNSVWLNQGTGVSGFVQSKNNILDSNGANQRCRHYFRTNHIIKLSQ